jgi:hypothetical protein
MNQMEKDWNLAVVHGQYVKPYCAEPGNADEMIEFRRQDLVAFVAEVRAQAEARANRCEKALAEICEWTERYTSPGHPITTVAKRALERPCTCNPDDDRPEPCVKQYALSECKKVGAGDTVTEGHNAK